MVDKEEDSSMSEQEEEAYLDSDEEVAKNIVLPKKGSF